jgi:sugar lactone lactonase YvrE
MANSQAMCTSFKVEILGGVHAIGTPPTRGTTAKDTFKAALYETTATLGAGTTAYNASGEVSGAGYTAGGITVTNAIAPSSSGTTAYWTPSASLTYSAVTLTTAFDAVLIYNSTQSDKAVAVYTFGAQTVTAGNFILTMPTNDSSTALMRIV